MELIVPHVRSRRPADVARDLRESGYVVLEGALTADCVACVNAETGDLQVTIGTEQNRTTSASHEMMRPQSGSSAWRTTRTASAIDSVSSSQ